MRSVLIARSHATEACEPRQVRKEAALSNVTRVPWVSLEGASVTDTVRVRHFEGGCTVALTPRVDPSKLRNVSALYRTHRPQDFGQVVGQAHVVQTLRNAVELDRVAHAYLFAGPRGTGKTSMAKILAKSINCEQGPTVTPCLVCESCRSIHDATAIDVIEMDAASHRGIDDIREIRDRVALRPARGRMKVYIVDEAHMLTKEASNAVLKTLEEPPDHVVFVLCTTELQAMLPTIRSRCQRFVFQRPGLGEISEVLRRIATAEGIEIDDAAVNLVARAAGGSFRDGVTILDQLSTAQSAAIGAEDVRALLGTADEASLFGAIDLVGAGDAAGLLRLVDDLAESGTDLAPFTTGLIGHLRGLFLTQQLGQPPLDLGLSDHEQERMREQAGAVTPRAVVRLIDLLRTVVDDVKEGGDPRLPLELALVKVSRPANELALEALDQRLSQLESSGASPAPPEATAGCCAGPAGRSRTCSSAARSRSRTGSRPRPRARATGGVRAGRHRGGRAGHAGRGQRTLVGCDRARDRAPLGAAALAGAVRPPGLLRGRHPGAGPDRIEGVRQEHHRGTPEPADHQRRGRAVARRQPTCAVRGAGGRARAGHTRGGHTGRAGDRGRAGLAPHGGVRRT